MAHRKAKLSDALLSSLSCPPRGGRVEVRDTQLPGFLVEVSARHKRFVVRCRGIYRTVGKWPIMTIQEARIAALEVLRGIELGHYQELHKDSPLAPLIAAPSVLSVVPQVPPPAPITKAKAAECPTLKETLGKYLEVKRMKPRTAQDYRVVLRRHWKDYLDRPLSDLTGDAVLERFRAITSPSGGNYSLRLIGALFRFHNAAHTDSLIIPTAKVLALEGAHHIRPKSRMVLDGQQRAWCQAVQSEAGTTGKDLFVFLACTGLRLGEARSLGWGDINHSTASITIQETKNGRPHTLPLGKRMMALIEARKGLYGESSPLVFPINERNVRKAVYKTVAKCSVEWSCHDLRRGFVSLATRLGISDRIVKRLVNHSESDVTGRHYIHLSQDALRPHIQAIEDALWALWEGTVPQDQDPASLAPTTTNNEER